MKALVSTLLTTVLVTAFYSGETDAAIDRDIVLAMPFDEGEGKIVKDLSPHGNHGTLKGNVSWGAGKFGNAVQFEPIGYVDAGNHRSLRLFKSDFTLAMWVKMKVTGGPHALIAQDEGGGPHKWILGYSGGSFYLHSITGHSESTMRFGVGKSNLWHQVAVVRRYFEDSLREELTFFLDGRRGLRTGSFGNSGDFVIPRFNEVPITIGWAEEDISLDGSIDEVLIAKRAFTDDEITAHFEGGIKRGLGLAVQPEGKSTAAWGAIKAKATR